MDLTKANNPIVATPHPTAMGGQTSMFESKPVLTGGSKTRAKRCKNKKCKKTRCKTHKRRCKH